MYKISKLKNHAYNLTFGQEHKYESNSLKDVTKT